MQKTKVVKFPSLKNYINNDFFLNYSNCLKKTLNLIDYNKVKKISDIIFDTIKKNKQIFVAGNGGSGAVANHFLCDFNKGIKISSKKKLKPRIISLTNSVESITAISNDIKFDEIFTQQIENYLNKGDLVIIFSCSGKSKNIIKLLNYLQKNKVNIVYITGFSKKKIYKKSIAHLNLFCENYGIKEDIFSSLMHMISQYIRFNYSKKEIL